MMMRRKEVLMLCRLCITAGLAADFMYSSARAAKVYYVIHKAVNTFSQHQSIPRWPDSIWLTNHKKQRTTSLLWKGFGFIFQSTLLVCTDIASYSGAWLDATTFRRQICTHWILSHCNLYISERLRCGVTVYTGC